MADNPTTLGHNIRAARIKRKLSQQQAAALLGVPYQRWQEWESADSNPTAGNLFAIADALRVRVDRLRPQSG